MDFRRHQAKATDQPHSGSEDDKGMPTSSLARVQQTHGAQEKMGFAVLGCPKSASHHTVSSPKRCYDSHRTGRENEVPAKLPGSFMNSFCTLAPLPRAALDKVLPALGAGGVGCAHLRRPPAPTSSASTTPSHLHGVPSYSTGRSPPSSASRSSTSSPRWTLCPTCQRLPTNAQSRPKWTHASPFNGVSQGTTLGV